MESLYTPLQASACDVHLLAQVIHHTEPMRFLLSAPSPPSGNHSEYIWFNRITSPQAPLVLGYAWLALHNPM